MVSEKTYNVMISEESVGEQSPYAESESALEPVQRAAALRDNRTAAGIIAQMSAAESVIDEPYTVGYAPVADSDWVVVSSPRSAEFGLISTISNYGLYRTILAVLCIGIAGTIIGYSTSTAVDRLTGKTEQMREGNLDVEVSTTRIDNIGRLYDGFAEMRDDLKAQIDEAEKARKEAEVSQAGAVELSKYLKEKAEEHSEVMQQCADGDFTQRMAHDSQNDSMNRIATEFNEMMSELEQTVGQLKPYVEEGEAVGSEVEQSATLVQTASKEVADAVQTIAVDADTQRDDLQTVLADLDRLTDEAATTSDESTFAGHEWRGYRETSNTYQTSELGDYNFTARSFENGYF